MNAVLAALCQTDPRAKCGQVAALRVQDHAPRAADDTASDEALGIPGRPALPRLIHPRDVPQRGLGTPAGRAALIHAVAHIEFNAINLALDAAWRFAGMPADYYADWISVAQDEARHFGLLTGRLADLGYAYGDFEAHNGLWEAAQKTAHDVLKRMALVPRVLEARGLDVTPAMIRRLDGMGDVATADVLRVILSEEVRHVAIGTRWFRERCAQRALEPVATFRALLREEGVNLREPLNRDARAEAGFVAEELLEAR